MPLFQFQLHLSMYWLELELLQVESKDKTAPNTYFSPKTKDMGVGDVYSPEGELLGGGLQVR